MIYTSTQDEVRALMILGCGGVERYHEMFGTDEEIAERQRINRLYLRIPQVDMRHHDAWRRSTGREGL